MWAWGVGVGGTWGVCLKGVALSVLLCLKGVALSVLHLLET